MSKTLKVTEMWIKNADIAFRSEAYELEIVRWARSAVLHVPDI